MIRRGVLVYFFCGLYSIPAVTADVAAQEKLALDHVISRIINHYPSVKLAQLEVERSRQEFYRIESQLGWVLNTNIGLSRDVGTFDIPSQRFESTVSLSKTVRTGSTLQLSGNYTYEDSETTAIPVLVNPSQRTRLDLNYRIPLLQGEDNPKYFQNLELAQAGYDLVLADKVNQINALVTQTTDLYFNAATTLTRIDDANEAIGRALRLVNFVKKNFSLGLAEKKDLLDVRALYLSKVAERDNLLVAWGRQRTELNRLMGQVAQNEFLPQVPLAQKSLVRADVLKQFHENSAALRLQQAQLKRTSSEIALAHDAKKDKLDLILSVGARNTSGDIGTSSVSNDEWAGGARLEYRYAFDQRGFDSELYQKILQKQVIEEEINRIKTEISYEVDGILEQINKTETSLQSIERRLRVEKEKVADAFERYKIGRSNTNELIDNENALFASSLLYKTRRIELSRLYTELDLKSGLLWDTRVLTIPADVYE